jgi:flagellar basal-body rod protein FlgC
MYGVLDVAVSGMIAQRTRLDVIAANVANSDAILDSSGKVNPYRRRAVFFAPGDPTATTAEGRALGVHVADIRANGGPPRLRHNPSSPYAYKDGPNAGYEPVPDVDLVMERVDEMSALRAYEASVVAAETTKTMLAQGLRLIA